MGMVGRMGIGMWKLAQFPVQLNQVGAFYVDLHHIVLSPSPLVPGGLGREDACLPQLDPDGAERLQQAPYVLGVLGMEAELRCYMGLVLPAVRRQVVLRYA